MDHFVNIPIDTTGLMTDPLLVGMISEAMQAPFEFTDVFVYSHGWWTTANEAMSTYSRFSIDFLRIACSLPPAVVSLPPTSSFGVGIHWPSMLSENRHEIINLFEPLSFYQMEKRSDLVGQNALYALLKLMYQTRSDAQMRKQFRLTLIGHSFGCRVICQALQALLLELIRPDCSTDFKTFVASTVIKIVLIQPAMENIDLQRGEEYGDLFRLPLLNILVTTSELDAALSRLFPLAEHVNFLSKAPGRRIAMGYRGPSLLTMRDFNAKVISLASGYSPSEDKLLPPPSRMLICDLTQIHRTSEVVSSALTGHHSDIFHPEIYKIIAKFAFD